MKYTDQELKKLIEKQFKVSTFEVIETENWLKIKSNSGSFRTGKEGKKKFYDLIKQEFLNGTKNLLKTNILKK